MRSRRPLSSPRGPGQGRPVKRTSRALSPKTGMSLARLSRWAVIAAVTSATLVAFVLGIRQFPAADISRAARETLSGSMRMIEASGHQAEAASLRRLHGIWADIEEALAIVAEKSSVTLAEIADGVPALSSVQLRAPSEIPKGFPEDFDASKKMLAAHVYFDTRVDWYCACEFDSRNRVAASCPLQTSVYEERAQRIEIEHIVAASDFGRQRECWRSPPAGADSRKHCGDVDPLYRAMEADPHNLIPVVGALNALRLNYRFGMVPRGEEDPRISGCGFKFFNAGSEDARLAEPPDSAKGLVARAYFYMEDRYGHAISRQQRRLFEAWDRQFPPSGEEIERNRRIYAQTGVWNIFVEAAPGP